MPTICRQLNGLLEKLMTENRYNKDKKNFYWNQSDKKYNQKKISHTKLIWQYLIRCNENNNEFNINYNEYYQ